MEQWFYTLAPSTTHPFRMPQAPSIALVSRRLRACLSSRMARPDERFLLLSMLQEMGFEKAGEGAFGATFLMQKTAVKVVLTKESQGYLAYARFCRKHHATNRLLPRVDAIRQVGRHSLVWMERLHENDDLSKSLRKPLKRASRSHQHVNEAGRLIGRSSASLAQVMDKLRSILDERRQSYWDIRSPNILFRRERGEMKMVLTDPIAY